MANDDEVRWSIVVYMKMGFKLQFFFGDNQGAKSMAHEQARMTLERGTYVDDDRGIRTYYPASWVDKVKVIPPGVTLNSTGVEFV